MARDLKEAKMYPAVKKHLKGRHGCDHVCADLPGDNSKVRVPRNLRNREIDVAGISRQDGDLRVHLAEGKTFAKGTSFDDCVHQIEAVAAYGDYLWVFFPKEEWNRLEDKDRTQNKEILGRKDLGLILVHNGDCDEIMTAPRNKRVDSERRSEVLSQMGLVVEKNDFPMIDTLGNNDARLAASAIELCACVASLIKEETGKFSFDPGDPEGHNAIRSGWFTVSWWGENDVCVEMDPFGCYLRDGKPVAVVSIAYDEKGLNSFLAEKRPFGTHCFFDNGKWSWKTLPFADLSPSVIASLKQQGYDYGGDDYFNVVHVVELIGRNQQTLKDQLVQLIRQAKKLSS